MWYRQMLAAYSSELGMLKDHLKGGVDPYDYSHMLPDYWDQTGDDEAYDKYADDPHEYLYDATEEQQKPFTDWLQNNRGYQDGYDAPAYEAMDYRGLLRPQWMVHFTDSPDEIAKDGFQYGHEDMRGVHLTTHKENRKQGPGYNFALPADSRDAQLAQFDKKYGEHGVLFYGGGLEAYHSGDEESQVVFWGPSANKRMIFPIHRNRDTGNWDVYDHTGREQVAGKTYQEAIQFIKTNWRMLQQVRDKAEQGKLR